FPTGGATDDETKRHNNLRRDILTSLLEVDQSIKGLEHSLGGRIRQIEDRLQEPRREGTGAGAARCGFDPAAATPWALKILQENLSPIASGLASVQSTLRSLEGREAEAQGLEALRRDLAPLRDALPALQRDTETVRAAVAELQGASPVLQGQ